MNKKIQILSNTVIFCSILLLLVPPLSAQHQKSMGHESHSSQSQMGHESHSPQGRMEHESHSSQGRMEHESHSSQGQMGYESHSSQGQMEHESHSSQGQMEHESRSSQGQMEHESHSSQGRMDHSTHVGKRIHESEVDGHSLAYHVLDLPGSDVQHLMVYIMDPKGNPVTDGKVGYLVVGPDGVSQKVMAMGMKEAFGGDVDLNKEGKYVIKIKAVYNDAKLIDEFNYEIDN